VGYFFIEEADEVCGELMDAGVGVERGEGGVAPFFVGFVDEGGGEFGVQFDRFFREDMFNKRFDGNIVMAVDGSEVGICADALGEELLVT